MEGDGVSFLESAGQSSLKLRGAWNVHGTVDLMWQKGQSANRHNYKLTNISQHTDFLKIVTCFTKYRSFALIIIFAICTFLGLKAELVFVYISNCREVGPAN